MEKTFEFRGLSFKAYTNGKNYNGRQYVEVKQVGSYQKAAKGEWNISEKFWAKQPGGPQFNDAIAEALELK